MKLAGPRALCWSLAPLAVLCLASWWFMLALPGAQSFDEVQLANLAWHWQHGTIPYADPWQPPAPFNPYGPLPTWLIAQCGRLGLSPWLAMRLLALVPTVGILVVGAIVLRRRHGGGAMLLALATMALATRPVFWIHMRGRVDGLATALAVAGFLAGLYGRGKRSALAAAVLLCCATLTKASMVAAPLALAAALATSRRRRGLAIGLAWLLLVVGAVSWLQAITYGGYGAGLHRPITHPLRPFEMAFRTITTTALWLLWILRVWLELSPEQRRACYPWCWYAWLALVIGSATSAARGASWNYLFEFYIVLALATARLWATGPRPRLAWLLVAQMLGGTLFVAITENPVPAARHQAELRRDALDRLRPFVAAGQRVAVYHNFGASEALLALQGPSGLDIVDGLALSDEEAEPLARAALATGRVDVVLHGAPLQATAVAAR